MKKEKDESIEKEFEGGQVQSIKSSDDRPTFWKPKKVGEIVEGVLTSITDGRFGKVLKISTRKGVVGINVGFFLADIDFTEYADQKLRFTYKGEVGKRGCRVFDVDRVVEKDELPF